MKLIPLSQNSKKNRGKYFAQVDDEDYDYLMQWRWSLYKSKFQKQEYAMRVDGGKQIRMHRVLLKINDRSIWCDHKDHNGLNNQKNNIRKCSSSDNSKNRIPYGVSKYLGVSRLIKKTKWFRKKTQDTVIYTHQTWSAQIKANGKYLYLGVFKNEDDAAKAYNEAAKKYHGEFANLNVIL